MLAGLTSCKSPIIYEGDIASVVYFIEAVGDPLKVVSTSDLDTDGCMTYTLYDAGNNSATVAVSVYEDANALDIYNVKHSSHLKMLPEAYYNIGQTSYSLDTGKNYRKEVKVRLDIRRFLADGLDPEEYILAMSVGSDDVKAISPENKTLFIKFAE